MADPPMGRRGPFYGVVVHLYLDHGVDMFLRLLFTLDTTQPWQPTSLSKLPTHTARGCHTHARTYNARQRDKGPDSPATPPVRLIVRVGMVNAAPRLRVGVVNAVPRLRVKMVRKVGD